MTTVITVWKASNLPSVDRIIKNGTFLSLNGIFQAQNVICPDPAGRAPSRGGDATAIPIKLSASGT